MPKRMAMAAAISSRKSVDQRVAAMAHTTRAVLDDNANLQAMLKVLRDPQEPAPVRLAALDSIQAASFAVVEFESCRGDFIAALRAIATDADPEVRTRALATLAAEKDGFAQQKLLAGLEDPTKALVPPEKALQFLSYDIHAEAYPLARALLNDPPSEAVKYEALRVLSADTSSQPLFERLLRDKKETKENRQLAASALQSIAPATLQTHARALLLDPKEYDDIQATSLSALTHFGNTSKIAKDEKLLKRVDSLRKSESNKLKQVARSFSAKFNA